MRAVLVPGKEEEGEGRKISQEMPQTDLEECINQPGEDRILGVLSLERDGLASGATSLTWLPGIDLIWEQLGNRRTAVTHTHRKKAGRGWARLSAGKTTMPRKRSMFLIYS